MVCLHENHSRARQDKNEKNATPLESMYVFPSVNFVLNTPMMVERDPPLFIEEKLSELAEKS
jgi:hypothetical protein